MNFEFFVSLRYLLAKRRQTFISLITFISIAGVAVGVTALIVVLAVMNGFQRDLRDRILGITSHIVVGRFDATIADYPKVIDEIKQEPGVTGASPYVYTQVMLSSGRGVSGALLRGIDPGTAGEVVNIQKDMIRGNLTDLEEPSDISAEESSPGIILGVELANNLGIHQRDWVTVISPTGRLTPIGQTPKSRLFQVVGIFQSGMFEYDNTLAYISLKAAQQFLGIGDVVSGVEVRVTDIYAAQTIAKRLRARLGPSIWVRDWMQMNRNLFSALKLEKVVMFIILTLIVLVAAFNIVSSLIMLVMEKTRDIAILKAMGATTASIRKIFVLEGIMIGVSGTILGLIGGFGLCAVLKKYRFIELPRDVYYISTLPVHLEGFDVAVIAFSAIAISLIATLYPSRQAAKLEPAEALRYE
ncbi:lipoprotein-releasing ABC transporter permease subunit [Desulfoferrobacter suflitae]|uniref:lipoprotein-releasing ABC transporter permease subunit n=1 Tax=Desulfoferrobacter suflitae TaxID=2865782 RepID=UPI002164A8C4|nr:lipoprotein-releasing ABC transporter permease subunit [Desulfoferrobacter suflitae]MCK8600576.1 lipoprotein-releasing ABC transporter permease subunit [Desulfoferrobacter suflitae]